MRDAFGEIDPDEIDVIDLVEPDIAAFAEHGESEIPNHRGNGRRWLVAAAIAGAVGIVGAALLVWTPWREDNTASFPDGRAPELTLTEELVFDDPPAELTASSLGNNTGEDIFTGGFANAEGYFFAEPGVAWDILGGGSEGIWAAFFAVRESDQDDEQSIDMEVDDRDTAGTVQGAPAVVGPVDAGIREISFGPVQGWMFSTITSRMSLNESLNFAEAVSVDDGVPTLSDVRVIGEMLPIGDMADYDVAIGSVLAAISPFGMQPGIVSVHYGDFVEESADAYSIATEPVVGETTMAMLRFLMDGAEGRSVHGLPAIVVDEGQDRFGFASGQTNSLVAWVEGGRLIVVAGPDDVDATLALAETVRPATDDEWAEVVDVSQVSFIPDDTTSIEFGAEVTLYEVVDDATGASFALTAQIDEDGAMSICTEQQSADASESTCDAEIIGEPPLLRYTDGTIGRQFVYAIVERGLGVDAEIRITYADGTIETFLLVEVSRDLPGLAVATVLPDEFELVELWVGEEVVRTL